MSADVEHELPDTVVTTDGSSRKYHRPDPLSDDPQPRCIAPGRNHYEKDRETIESHYEPCGNCFPRAADADE